MANVGYATLTIIPSMRGLQGAVQGQLGGMGSIGQKAGSEAGQGFAGRFTSFSAGAIRSIGGALVSGVTTAAATAGTAAGAVLGVSLFTGFKRFTTIQDATAALTISLQSATKAGQLMNQVLGVVKGTPFSLDQFAQAAQQMAGFGIAADKIPGILIAIGDASATQGKQAGQFAGQLTEVFGQIAAKGQVQLQDVWRISETGVNALAILANHFGLTTDAMKDLITAGAVPAGEAIDALTQGIEKGSSGIAGSTVSLAGTMKSLGEQVSGALANLTTGFARFGATIIAPFAPALVAGFKGLTALMDTLGARIAPALAGFAQGGGKFFIDFMSTLPAKIGPALDALKRLGPSLVPLAAAFAAVAANASPLGFLLPHLNPLVAGFAALAATSPELRGAFEGLLKTIEPVASAIGTQLAGALQQLIPALGPIITALGPAFNALLTALVPIITALVPPLLQVFGALVQLVPPLGQLVVAFAPILGLVAQLAASLLSALLPALIPIITGLAQLVALLAQHQEVLAVFGAAVLASLVPAFIAWAVAAASAAIATIAATWPILAVIAGIALLAVGIRALVENWSTVAAFFTDVWGKVTAAFSTAIDWITGHLGLLARVALDIMTGGMAELVRVVVTHWDDIVSFFTGIPGRITGAIGDLAGAMFNLGVDAMESLGRGLWSLIGKLGDIADRIKNKLVDTLNPANWFSTPEEHYRMLWGAAFAAIGDEGRKSLSGITSTVSAVTAAATPGALAPISLPLSPHVIGTDGAALGGDIPPHSHDIYMGAEKVATATAPHAPGAARQFRRSQQ